MKDTMDADCLYRMVVVIGPALFGSIFKSNSETVWSRIEKPASFRYEEIKALSEVFQISTCEFMELIEMQIAYNKSELLKSRPIGREKYTSHYYL